MISAESFIECVRELGFSQFVGVPCSFLKPLINCVISDRSLSYLGAASEGEAIGLALGAYLAGRKTVVMCQNSGLGNTVNPLTSLNNPFRIPTLLITTWRGQPGIVDEPQHDQMGRIMVPLAHTLELPWAMLPKCTADMERVLRHTNDEMDQSLCPFILFMEKGTMEEYKLQSPPPQQIHATELKDMATPTDGKRPTRTQAIECLLATLRGDEALIATTGKTGRELYRITDRDNHLYVVGGMGTAPAIGLGIANTLPEQRVVVLDGDGALLMKMGVMATIGHYQPSNLLHIVLDNEQHDSTGGQATVSPTVDFARVAAATNYRYAYAAKDYQSFEQCLSESLQVQGPTLIHLKLAPGSPKDLPRPKIAPFEVKDRFRSFLAKSKA